jgi:hypothetical protein
MVEKECAKALDPETICTLRGAVEAQAEQAQLGPLRFPAIC